MAHICIGGVPISFDSVETAFKGETIHYVELAKYHDAPSALLAALDAKGTACKGKARVLVAADEGHDADLSVFDSTFLFVVLKGAAVKEEILFSRVAVHIAVQNYLSLPLQIPNQLLGMEDRWVQVQIGCAPLPIQIATQQRAAVVAVNYALRI